MTDPVDKAVLAHIHHQVVVDVAHQQLEQAVEDLGLDRACTGMLLRKLEGEIARQLTRLIDDAALTLSQDAAERVHGFVIVYDNFDPFAVVAVRWPHSGHIETFQTYDEALYYGLTEGGYLIEDDE